MAHDLQRDAKRGGLWICKRCNEGGTWDEMTGTFCMAETEGEIIATRVQLNEWLDGNSVHQRGGACVPDFSCCLGPSLLAHRPIREHYVDAIKRGDIETQNLLLSEFIRAVIAHKTGATCDAKQRKWQ